MFRVPARIMHNIAVMSKNLGEEDHSAAGKEEEMSFSFPTHPKPFCSVLDSSVLLEVKCRIAWQPQPNRFIAR